MRRISLATEVVVEVVPTEEEVVGAEVKGRKAEVLATRAQEEDGGFEASEEETEVEEKVRRWCGRESGELVDWRRLWMGERRLGR